MTTSPIWRWRLVVGCFPNKLNEEAVPTLIQNSHAVNSWPKESDVEAARPSHCRKCNVGARCGDNIQLQGHGLRQRQVWGPPWPGAEPEVVLVVVRRYRCSACAATMTACPKGLAKSHRYSLPAIAAALLRWALHEWPAPEVRGAISPWRAEGLNAQQRWRSLLRWSRRGSSLFRLGKPPGGGDTSHRNAAHRVAHIVLATAPPAASELQRISLAAQLI
jgi:hypothetical protein